jgi:hypothetical protein
MQRRYLWLIVTLALIFVGATGYVAAGGYLYAQYQTSRASFTSSCGSLISWNPPSKLYTGLYVNAPDLVMLNYRSPMRQTLRISVSIPQYTDEHPVQVTATQTFQQHAFKPPINPAALDSLVEPGQRAAQVHLRVDSLSKTLCDTSVPITLLSRQWMQWYGSGGSDNFAYLAGWVTPNATAIDHLVARATNRLATPAASSLYPDTSSLHGYVGGTSPGDVRGQVNVLFDTLQLDYHVKYSLNTIQGDSQRIQLPADVLSESAPTAMCVETTAILASAIEHLGMRPYIIIVPGHAFLGVALGADPGAPIDFWETSFLEGQSSDTANAYGRIEYESNQRQGKVLRVIDIQYERQHGIAPIE